ncbi:MmgE/PrpD family protein [Martelella mediterranea]|uniref:MmgE/PrpD family protein n=1 Tax=Martelella mediterranea TaxID=293089 RepID=UPI001E60DA32|nr:MmgE/PrpD family protein [Martelella mediterranea]MCD1636460.1 MmgE/PrpD family protein [Martelella mediterranea]
MSPDPTQTLSEQLAELTEWVGSRPLPGAVTQEIKLCFLDFLAATLAAPSDAALPLMANAFGEGPARLLHRPERISVAGAAYVHGFLATVEDIDDAHALASGMHLSATVFPVALALAQSGNLPMRRVLRGAVAGYEVAGRLVRSMDAGLRKTGFHSTGAIGPFAACATAGVILGLSRKQQTDAFGIAANGAGGLFAFLPTGASSRHSHGANACVTGLMAALAAKGGVTGPADVFEAPDGFIRAYAGECDRSFIDRQLSSAPEDFEVHNAYHKRFMACGHAIPSITMALESHAGQASDPDDIIAVRIYGYKASAALTRFPVPSVSAAKFSLPVIFALAALYGDVSAREMRMEVIERSEVQALAARTQVFEDRQCTERFPKARCGRVEIDLASGGTVHLETDAPVGMPANPLQFDDVSRKFLAIAPEQVAGMKRNRVVEVVRDLADNGGRFPAFKA